MKASIACIILGGVAIGGYAAYKYWESAKNGDHESPKGEKTESFNNSVTSHSKSGGATDFSNISSEETLDEAVEKLEFNKTDIQNDVVKRHEAAAKVIKDSMEHILAEDTEIHTSENAENLDKIDDALDQLLDE